MNGSTILHTGNKKINLCIHFDPGARGDFLASILLDSFIARDNSALKSPNYRKIHDDFHIEKPYLKKCICIRIDDNKSVDNLMQIVFNHFLKNRKKAVNECLDDFYEQIKGCHRRQLKSHPGDYDYWIDFSYLNNVEFLKALYLNIYNREILFPLIDSIEQNIQKQLHWKSNPELEKLSWLIDFELRCNLFDWYKTFSINDYITHLDPKSLLNFSNYSRVPFII